MEEQPVGPAPDAEDAATAGATAAGQAVAPADPAAVQAQRLVRRSWVMLPLVLISLLAAILFALLMSAFAGVDPIDPLRDQGFAGWAVFIVSNLVLWPLPAYFGVWFAARAARLGSARAITPLIANGFVIAVVWSLSLLSILAEL